MCNPTKWQKYNTISIVPTKYFNWNQVILLWKKLESFKKKHYTILFDKKKMLMSAKVHHFDW